MIIFQQICFSTYYFSLFYISFILYKYAYCSIFLIADTLEILAPLTYHWDTIDMEGVVSQAT